MSDKKPCIIYQDPLSKRWLAWNEDARMIAHSPSWRLLHEKLADQGYEQLPWNSYAASQIRDKMRLQGKGMVEI